MSGIIGSAGSKSGVIGTTELDYEQGTYTPVIKFGGSTEAMGGSVGSYVKVGQMCLVQVRIYGDGSFSNSGTMQMTLPFTLSSVTDLYVGMNVAWSNGAAFGGQFASESDPGQAQINFTKVTSSSSTPTVAALTNSDINVSFQIRATFTFRTT